MISYIFRFVNFLTIDFRYCYKYKKDHEALLRDLYLLLQIRQFAIP